MSDVFPDPGAEDPAPEPAVIVRGLTLRGPWGPVYGPVDLDVTAGGVTVELRRPDWAHFSMQYEKAAGPLAGA